MNTASLQDDLNVLYEEERQVNEQMDLLELELREYRKKLTILHRHQDLLIGYITKEVK